ncbi:iron-containing alcohol dehydrogenase [Ectobacillus ponti]|uniref:Iron-containing alcohol dehydrogenase n=1 Tax=Ectobacillus ponti TaxID=2961894 RepID=A0AA41XCQ1_9BACI|nr:iron-containing alcohol dehydrogenase [Ectobacillus ponti]MCP8970924.1 iron-containing alcohol dehydrogenase [Ectobacillus ponti]
MRPFQFSSRTEVAYGIQRVSSIGEDIARLGGGSKVVLVTDPGLVALGVAEQVSEHIRQAGIEVLLFSNVASDPSAASIDEAAAIIRESNVTCVIGLGGGSAMDVAKMAALTAGDQQPAEHYALMANPFQPKKIASIMIPTTSGTGAEVTSTVVFSTKEKRKVWGWDASMAPELAVLDPSLTVALPPHLTAATGLDALVHAMEAMTGKRQNAMIEALSLQAIQLISANLPRVLLQPDDLDARGALSIGAMLAGMAIEQGGTGIAHCIGHALGTLGRIHHGRAVAIALYTAYEWNVAGDVAAHAKIARALGAQGESAEELAYAGGQRFRQLVEESGIKLSLQEDGLSKLDEDRFVETMQAEENAPMRRNNCRETTEEDLRRFARAILAY